MTQTLTDEPTAQDSARLFHSPVGLFPFQEEAAASIYLRFVESDEHSSLVLWDTGMGKTVLSLAVAALMVEDGLLDQILVVAEANKVNDWALDDIPEFTRLTVDRYIGPSRSKRLVNPPQVLVTTYETGRADICRFKARSKAVAEEGPLSTFLKGKRVLIVFDEFSRLRSRNTKTYVAWDYLVNRVLRRDKAGRLDLLGLTGTTVEKNPIDHWNAGRIVSPERAGTVSTFESTYIAAYDNYGNPIRFKNLSAADCAPQVTPLSQLFGPLTLRKRKTDPDVIDQFPTMVENPPTHVHLGSDHQRLYEAIEDAYQQDGIDEFEARVATNLLRQFVGSPAALLRSQGQAAQGIVAAVGADTLQGLSNAKIEALLTWLERMGEQQVVVFTFFGQSILPQLENVIGQNGYRVVVNHGAMSMDERHRSQMAFKSGDAQVFLSSDAGAKGLNLGVGSGLLHYELPVLYSTYVQRLNRIHRINSKHPSVTVDSLVALDTIEVPFSEVMLRRNEWSEQTMGDTDADEADPGDRALTHADRLRMLRSARKRAESGV